MSTHWPSTQLKSRLLERYQTLVIPVVPLKAFWLNCTEMSCYFSHLSESSGSWIWRILKFRVLTSSSTGNTGTAVSSPPSAKMPKGCLFPDLIPNRDVSQRFLTRLTREGSLRGGFHCLAHKDRITWGENYTVHVCYINTKTVVREYNKGLRCVKLKQWVVWFPLYKLPKLETNPNLGASHHENQN